MGWFRRKKDTERDPEAEAKKLALLEARVAELEARLAARESELQAAYADVDAASAELEASTGAVREALEVINSIERERARETADAEEADAS